MILTLKVCFISPHKLLFGCTFGPRLNSLVICPVLRNIEQLFAEGEVNINLLLTEREGQYSPVRLEQARLVSSLLYGTVLEISGRPVVRDDQKVYRATSF